MIGSSFSFFIAPKKDYTIIFDVKNKIEPFKFIGENADGQYLLNRLKHSDYQDKADFYTAKDTVFASVKEKILKDAESENNQYKSLFLKKKINQAFFDYAQSEVKYYYAAVLSSAIQWNTKRADFVAAWPDVFKTYSLIDDKALAATNFYDFADTYAMGYQNYLRRQAGFNKRFNTRVSNDYLIDWHQLLSDNLTGKTKEYVLARFLYNYMSLKKYEPEFVDLFSKFKKDYPKSNYSKFIQPLNDEITSFHQKAKSANLKDEKIIDNYLSIKTLEELTGMFKGKTVFVDLWATWCGPCKEEFAFNKNLKKFLKEKNIEILYISMDDDNRDKQWKDMIKYYELTGTHIRTSDILRKDIAQKIWGTQSYSIPRYLIIKGGKIVENDALRPSSKQDLYNQISKYLM
jgi:thiol-disulfide isomerase/thioredoxin